MYFSEKNISNLIKVVFFGLAVLMLIMILSVPFGRNIKREKKILVYESIDVVDPSQILLFDEGKVKPMVYNLKTDLAALEQEERKTKFIGLLLPSILIAQDRLNKERIKTMDLLAKQKAQVPFNMQDSILFKDLSVMYDTEDLERIIDGQITHPVSIVLAQAALETGWGQSRFFRDGNNAFGIWSYNSLDDRMHSLSNRDGVKIYLRKYDGILESVMDYYRTISRSWAFTEFVAKRRESDNPFELIWYLNMYSESRYDYVQKLGELILANDLIQYDTFKIDDNYIIAIHVDE